MSNAERGAAGGAADGGAAGQGDAAGHGGVPGGGAPRDGGATNAVEQTLRHLRTLDAPVEEADDAPSQGPLTLEDLYLQHRMRLVRLAILLVDEPATAEDVVQEAFTGLHRNWAKLRDAAAAVGYLRAAVVNGSRSVLRRRKTAREYVPPHAVNARSAESLAMLSTEHQAVVKALSKLPPRQREVLVLRYYGGLSEAEISEATGISKGTVKSTASRALEALQRTMPDSKR
ncbi:RNA polymerase sigma-70 factor (sigma-E family) [Prauserella isguenensis]|uniref:RNA polymerase sigma-70 factor (Sigma-E family) n=1 Tax=Prauserella isguenensis TaxID=1470180 RepID=A0A839RVV4_9PSEU|nr:SigE family RNA polymerase sigma factor [Prauserella isguenensis]MBB3049851.1 RNA polymerase sigma-70 factor (sigma-E family) [Prauserella isguenensis]